MPPQMTDATATGSQSRPQDGQSIVHPRIIVQTDIESTSNNDNIENKDVNSEGKPQLQPQTPLDAQKLEKKPSETTSTYVHDNEFIKKTDYELTFPWKKIGSFMDQDTTIIDNKDLKLNSKSAEIINKYIYEKYYADLYWNTSLIVCCCLSTYLLTYIGYGFFAFIFISICTFAVYRNEFRRFHINIRDDMQRIQSFENLGDRLESIDWLNNFLAKFWIIYMPALSDLVISNTNQILLDVSPPPPIDKLVLDEFTLGTKSPKIESIKSFTKLGKNIYQMDWNLNFTPNDISDMTQNELKNKIDPKIALGIRIGKGFVGASLPILVENMSFIGNLRIKIILSDMFPHIDIVSVCFLEPPKIDYSLKPVGGNTLGIDVMSVIPGLSSFVNNLINSNLSPIMYYPNTIDINPIDFIQKPSAIGCLVLKIRGAEYTTRYNINPYIKYGIENDFNNQYKTDIKFQTITPIFNETKFILINDIHSKLKFEMLKLLTSGNSTSLCDATFELQDLLQDPIMEFNESKLIKNNKNRGKVVYDLKWYPVLKPETLEDGTIINQFDSEIGIVNLNILNANGLNTSTSMIGKLSTFIEIHIDNKLIETSRIIKGNNNPDYNFQFESLVTNKSTSIIKIIIKDISSFEETTVATYESRLLDFLYLESNDAAHQNKDNTPNNSNNNNHIIKKFTEGEGKIKFSTEWKPLGPITENDDENDDISFVPPIGIFKINVVQCKNLMKLQSLGKLNTFVAVSTNNKVKGITNIVKDDKNPVYDDEFFISIYSENQKIKFNVYDTDAHGKNEKVVGQIVVDINKFFKDNKLNELINFNETLTKNGKKTGDIEYSMIYYPMMKIFSHQEIIQINERAADNDTVNNDLDELDEQAKYLDDYKKNPDDYEWVDILDENGLNNMLDMNKEKIMLSLEDLMKFNSGVLGINLISGQLSEKNAYVEFYIDDHSYPDFISRKSKHGKIMANSGDCFIRDLRNSILNIRITKTINPKYKNDIYYETVDSFNVVDLLKDGFDKPIDLTLDDHKISLVFEFVPTIDDSTTLFDTVENTGLLKISLNEANNLLSADRNGKSDPFVVGFLNNKQIFKTKTIKKTLNPVWNETFNVPVKSKNKQKLILKFWDWDMTGDNDPLGDVVIDLADLEANVLVKDNFNLSTQGTANLELFFKSGYLKPSTSTFISREETSPFNPYAFTKFSSTMAGNTLGFASDATAEVTNNLMDGANGLAGGAVGAVGAASDVAGDMLNKIGVNNIPGTSGHFTLKPPGFGHKKKGSVDTAFTTGENKSRVSSDMASVRTGSFNGSGAIPGRLTIVDFKPEGIPEDQLSFKVGLKSGSGSVKSIYKTNKYKVDNTGEIKIAENVKFKCDSTTTMVFTLRSVHHFGKSEDLGSGTIVLQDAAGIRDDIKIPIIGNVTGTLTVNFNYA